MEDGRRLNLADRSAKTQPDARSGQISVAPAPSCKTDTTLRFTMPDAAAVRAIHPAMGAMQVLMKAGILIPAESPVGSRGKWQVDPKALLRDTSQEASAGCGRRALSVKQMMGIPVTGTIGEVPMNDTVQQSDFLPIQILDLGAPFEGYLYVTLAGVTLHLHREARGPGGRR